MIDYMWSCSVDTAKKRPGIVELKNQLVSMGKIPLSFSGFYARLEKAFEQLSLREPLNFPPKTAAAMFWSAAIGAALFIAASKDGGPSFPAGADERLRESVLNAIVQKSPVTKHARNSKMRLPNQNALVVTSTRNSAGTNR
jgi:hypothetical protein